MTWVIGNWKSNGTRQRQRQFLEALAHRDISGNIRVVICPPATLLVGFADALGKTAIHCGAQNISATDSGAYTGELSGEMLQDSGAAFVIIGHSERREYYQETTAVLGAKFRQALAVSLRPIVCIGEPLAVRQSHQEKPFIAQQIEDLIALTSLTGWEHALLAYEPIWAIGTGETASLTQISDMHHHIRDTFSKHSATIARTLPILYGGSVKPSNAQDIFSLDDVDGGLIGGAALQTDDFDQLITAAEQVDQASSAT